MQANERTDERVAQYIRDVSYVPVLGCSASLCNGLIKTMEFTRSYHIMEKISFPCARERLSEQVMRVPLELFLRFASSPSLSISLSFFLSLSLSLSLSVPPPGACTNGLVLYTFSRSNMSRGMVVNYFVVSLAFADIFNSVITIPFTIAVELTQRHLPADFVCKRKYYCTMHCGANSGHLETSIVYFPMSERVSEVGEQVNK